VVVGDRVVPSTQALGTRAIQIVPGEEKATTKQVWHDKDHAAYFSTGVLADPDKLVVVANTVDPIPQANLVCFDPATGNVRWEKKKVGYFHAGVLRLGDGKLLVLDDAGTLLLLQPGEKECPELARAKVCEGTLVTPALAGGRLYTRDSKGITCVQLVP
jgi:hypothetical protein